MHKIVHGCSNRRPRGRWNSALCTRLFMASPTEGGGGIVHYAQNCSWLLQQKGEGEGDSTYIVRV